HTPYVCTRRPRILIERQGTRADSCEAPRLAGQWTVCQQLLAECGLGLERRFPVWLGERCGIVAQGTSPTERSPIRVHGNTDRLDGPLDRLCPERNRARLIGSAEKQDVRGEGRSE